MSEPISEIAEAKIILQQLHDNLVALNTPPIVQQLLAFVINILSGLPASIKADQQGKETQGPFEILGHNYTFTEEFGGKVHIAAHPQ